MKKRIRKKNIKKQINHFNEMILKQDDWIMATVDFNTIKILKKKLKAGDY